MMMMLSRGSKRPSAVPIGACLSAVAALLVATSMVGLPASAADAPTAPETLHASWGTSLSGNAGNSAAETTYRNIVRPSVSGTGLRIRLDNNFGSTPVTFSDVYVGVRSPVLVNGQPSGPAVVTGSNRRLTFQGQGSTTVPAGQTLYSDQISFPVVAQQDLAVSLYVKSPSPMGVSTGVQNISQYVTAAGAGDHAADETPTAYAARGTTVPWADALDVLTTTAGGIAALGDSITDGYCSRPDANDAYPAVLSTRFSPLPDPQKFSVINEGISGDSVFNVETRLDRDVLSQTGLTHVVMMIGTNDLTLNHSSSEIIAAYQRIIARVHAKGLRIIGGTLTPRGGFLLDTPQIDLYRHQLNDFIRAAGTFDGVADFDQLTKDPDPNKYESFNPPYDCGDHLHPSPAGYAVMGNGIPLTLFTPAPATCPAAPPATPRLRAAWGTSMKGSSGDSQANATYRQIARTAVSGSAVRIRLDNAFNTVPATFSGGFVGLRSPVVLGGRQRGADLVPGSNRKLTFGGQPSVTIPAGQSAYSDQVPLAVAAQQDLAVSLYVQSPTPLTYHTDSFNSDNWGVTQYATAANGGNHAADETGAAFAATGNTVYWLDAVDVLTPAAGSIVALGDSITEGASAVTRTNADRVDAYDRYPDVLERRLAQLPDDQTLGVVNEGISGDSVFNGETRLDRDVLSQTGVSHLVVLLGTNDLTGNHSAAEVIASLGRIATRAHGKNLKVIGGTILPRHPLSTPQIDLYRHQINDFIRASGTFDGVADFDQITKDPADFEQLLPAYNDGDGIHPTPAGYLAMGNGISLAPFGASASDCAAPPAAVPEASVVALVPLAGIGMFVAVVALRRRGSRAAPRSSPASLS